MDANFWLALFVALCTGAASAVAVIFTRGKNQQAILDELKSNRMQVEANGKLVADFEKNSDKRYNENKARFEKGFGDLSREIIQLNEHGGTAVALRIQGLSAQLTDHATRIHTLESGLSEIKVISTNVEWIKESMKDIKQRLDKNDGNKTALHA